MRQGVFFTACACGAILASCGAFDGELLGTRSPDAANPFEGGDAGIVTPLGGSGGAPNTSGSGGTPGSSGSGGLAGSGSAGGGVSDDCTPNPDALATDCPMICRERCNGGDDDCDGDIDEANMDDTCDLQHALAACIDGECLVVECVDGHRDCDQDPDNGCEIAPTDIQNCGRCGQVCELGNAIEGCVDDECTAIGCEPLFGDCDDDPNTCEARVDQLDSCGECGQSCEDLPNATPTCATGVCTPEECAGGYGDCNTAPEDGCEESLDGLEHCGGCGQACAFPGSTNDCGSGTCVATACSGDYADCDGDPFDGCESLNSSDHCGSCDAPCNTTLANVSDADCSGQSCDIDCAATFGDCDDDAANGCETAVVSLARCGACDTPCAIDHAEVSCDLGACTFVRCEPGWDDCNSDLDLDGCETSLNADTTCGTCDTDCTMTTDPVCSGGSCTDVICSAGTADCNQNGLPCEVNLQTDELHCGSCDAPCAFTSGITSHASGLSCLSGSCEPQCSAGWDDCDGDYRNGCEQPLTTLSHCTACGMACAIANASETCGGGSCQVDVCAADWADCNMDDTSCETQLGTTQNCTGCGMACNLTNAVPTCAGGAGAHSCAIASCTQTYFDNCDGMAGNGCEIDKRTNTAHCGACSNNCASHAQVQSATCGGSACNYTCASGWGNCTSTAGCETQLNTNTHCAGCNVACSRTNGMASCSTGSCQLTGCNGGFGNCDGNAANGCEALTSLTHCGACNAPCLIPNGTGTCATQTCAVSSCNAGWENCDGMLANGCERDIDPPAMGGQGPCMPDTGCTTFTHGGRPYYFCTTGRNWTDARARCQLQLLGDLVHINDAAEDAFVRSHLAAGINAWLGARDATTEGAWRWANDDVQFWTGVANGTAQAYENWNVSEPNDNGGNEDCAEMRAADGLWNDQVCTALLDFVCEAQADLCPSDGNKVNPGQCGCGVADTDGDGDGTANCNDGCPSDPLKTAGGVCGCGVADTNSDGDSLPDCTDGCDTDANKTVPGVCGCGVADVNTDGDAALDCNDACPFDPMRTTAPCGFNYTPSNFDPTTINFATAPTSTLDCGTTTVDTTGAVTITNWCGTDPVPIIRTQSGGPEIVILPLNGLTIINTATLRLIGPRPVVLAIVGNSSIAGIIDANASGTTPGAGGNYSCGTATGQNGSGSNSTGAGGGGGGGYGTNGGRGGDGGNGSPGNAGVARGNTNIVPLVGGCAGGLGGGCSATGAAGGGAFQISVSGTLTVTGTLRANGGIGTNGCGSEGGGTGGGAGGGILYEATTLSTGTATIQTNGGRGGNGSGGGNGGNGSTSSAAVGSNGGNDGANGGGGGGGGFGRVRSIDR